MTTQSAQPETPEMESPSPAIRTVSEDDDSHVIEGRISYSGQDRGRDTYRTRFSARTDFGLDLHPGGIPVLWHHGFDPEFGMTPIGRTMPTATFRSDPDGLWLQLQLDKHNAYYESRIRPALAERGADGSGLLGISQGSAEHSVRIDEHTGEVLAWPLHEVSLTPIRSNWFNTLATRAAETITIIEAARAEVSTADMNDRPDSDFAYIEPGGEKDDEGKTTPRSLRHFPIFDAAHVRNALARAPQSPFGEKAMPKIKAAAAKFNIDVADDAGRSDEKAPDTQPATRAGARNSAADTAALRGAHDAIASVLGMDCAGGEPDADDASRSDESPDDQPAKVTIAVREDEPSFEELAARLAARAAETGQETARRMTG